MVRQRVAALLPHWDWPDPAVLQDILALEGDAVPALAALLTPERLAAAHADGQADAVVYYAVHLLSEIGTPATLAPILGAYRQADESLREGLEDALLRLGPQALELAAVGSEEAARALYDLRRHRGAAPRPFLEQYRADYQARLEEQTRRGGAVAVPLPVVLSPKPGRNDPCWCGSGLKYKKCHLARDEKEKVRL